MDVHKLRTHKGRITYIKGRAEREDESPEVGS